MSDLESKIEAALEGVTEGPWHWWGHRQKGGMYLGHMEPGAGRCTVMDFTRQGLQGAQPRFSDQRVMVKAEHLAVQEVEYRDDIVDIAHPDARLIAASRQLLPDALAELRARAERIAELEWAIAEHVIGVDQLVDDTRLRPGSGCGPVLARLLSSLQQHLPLSSRVLDSEEQLP